MNEREALKMALEVFGGSDWHEEIVDSAWADKANKAIAAIKEALAQPEQDNTYGYASSLATAIWQKHYMKESPKFALLDTTEGVLTQIDNMTCGLVREKPAQPEQEPVAWMDEYGDVLSASVVDGSGLRNIPLYTAPPKRKWVWLTRMDLIKCGVLPFGMSYELCQAIESKLREKNGY